MTKTTLFARTSLRALLAAGPLFLLASNIGCAGSAPAELRLTCLESKATYSQQFDRAYVGKGAEGNTEIVLVHDEQSKAAGALESVRQIMYVKILWRPERGAKQGHPSYTNAGLHWYVLGNAPGDAQPTDVLEYTGAGFVALSDTPLGTQVTIRSATLKPAGNSNGTLNDPVGPAKLTGTFLAKKDANRVSELLEEVKGAVDAGVAQQASAQ